MEKKTSWNRLISSIFDSMSRGDSRETTLNFQVNRSSWRCCSSRSRGWYLARERVLRTVFFFSLSLFFKAARFNEERGEKGGEFIRGAACSSLCQQRQRELISFSLAEKAAQRRSKRKREPRGTNELREIHREIMQIFQSFFPLPSTSIVLRRGLSRVFFPPSPDKFALIRGMRIFLTRVSFFLFLIIFKEYMESWIFLYFQDMWRYI